MAGKGMQVTAKPKDKKGKEKEDKPARLHHQPVPPDITEARERMAYELRVVRGMKLNEITDELNKTFPAYPLKSDHEAVRKMIKRVQEQYAKRDKQKIEEVLAESAASIDWVRTQAIEAFEASKQIEKVVTQREQKPIEQKAKTQTGDAMYLKRILEAADLKAKLFGVAAPKKHELMGKDGAPLVPAGPIDLSKLGLSNEQLDILEQAATIIEKATQNTAKSAIESGNTS